MANFQNSSQPKWLMFSNQETAATKQTVAIPLGGNAENIQLKSVAKGTVYFIVKGAGHDALPALANRKDLSIVMTCSNGDEQSIIESFMWLISEAGTSDLDKNNRRSWSIVGKNASMISQPDRFNSKITGFQVDWDASA